ncbi:MAG: hypothetical protein AAFQ40_05290 [Cyanobacteria bacterium J06623_5]
MANRDACVNDNQYPFLVKDDIEFRCSFIRSVEHGQPVLIARVEIDIPTTSEELCSALWRHADELNIRLPMLGASARMTSARVTSGQIDDSQPIGRATGERNTVVKDGCSIVLSGLLCGDISVQNLSDFLNRMTRDLKVFLAYAKAHSIPLMLTPTSVTEPTN